MQQIAHRGRLREGHLPTLSGYDESGVIAVAVFIFCREDKAAEVPVLRNVMSLYKSLERGSGPFSPRFQVGREQWPTRAASLLAAEELCTALETVSVACGIQP